ncbi:MAG: hypothetical protein QNJ17_14410 [Desulfocapsaceae bacterium]|nr:hypothetical protein [Desulfocapsaceae bacterium]
MKKIIISSLLIIGLAAGFAYGHKSGHGYGMGGYGGHMMGHGMMGGGYGMMGGGYGNCPGMSGSGQKWDNEAKQKYFDETAELRREMHNKRFDYMEAYRDPNTTRAELDAIEKEIWDIHAELQEKAQQMR